MRFFNFADWLIILGYLCGIIGLGVWFGKDQRNTRDYFLGSKNTPWWVIGLSIVAAETSALTIISVPAMAYGGNMTFIQIIFGYVIARVLLAIVMVPHYLKAKSIRPINCWKTPSVPRRGDWRVDCSCSVKRSPLACASMSPPFLSN